MIFANFQGSSLSRKARRRECIKVPDFPCVPTHPVAPCTPDDLLRGYVNGADSYVLRWLQLNTAGPEITAVPILCEVCLTLQSHQSVTLGRHASAKVFLRLFSIAAAAEQISYASFRELGRCSSCITFSSGGILHTSGQQLRLSTLRTPARGTWQIATD